MVIGTSLGVVFAGAAALFSLLSVVVGRLNYADDELSRQNRIENRILNKERRVEYDRPPRRSSSFSMGNVGATLADTEPEFRFRVSEVLVTEKRGWGYLLDKIVHGFDGEVSVVIQSARWKKMTGNWIPEIPPDFDQVRNYDYDHDGVECEIRQEDSIAIISFPYADTENLSEEFDKLLNHIETELGEELLVWSE